MRVVKVCNLQSTYWTTQERLFQLRDELRKLMKDYKALTTPLGNKLEGSKRNLNNKKLIEELEDLIVVKRNSLDVNYNLHKLYAKKINQGVLIKIDMAEFDYGIFKSFVRGAY